MTLPYRHRIDWTDGGNTVTIWGPMSYGYRQLIVRADRIDYQSGSIWEAFKYRSDHRREVLGTRRADDLLSQSDIENWLCGYANR